MKEFNQSWCQVSLFGDKSSPNSVAYNNKHLFSYSQVCGSIPCIFILDPGWRDNSHLGHVLFIGKFWNFRRDNQKHPVLPKVYAYNWPTATSAHILLTKLSYNAKSSSSRADKYTFLKKERWKTSEYLLNNLLYYTPLSLFTIMHVSSPCKILLPKEDTPNIASNPITASDFKSRILWRGEGRIST